MNLDKLSIKMFCSPESVMGGEIFILDNNDVKQLLVYARSLEHDHKVMREALETYAGSKFWGNVGSWLTNGYLARTALSSLLVKDGE